MCGAGGWDQNFMLKKLMSFLPLDNGSPRRVHLESRFKSSANVWRSAWILMCCESIHTTDCSQFGILVWHCVFWNSPVVGHTLPLKDITYIENYWESIFGRLNKSHVIHWEKKKSQLESRFLDVVEGWWLHATISWGISFGVITCFCM